MLLVHEGAMFDNILPVPVLWISSRNLRAPAGKVKIVGTNYGLSLKNNLVPDYIEATQEHPYNEYRDT